MIIADIKASFSITEAFTFCFPGHKLEKRGNHFWTHCPFHEDRTPSFRLNLENSKFRCFGCQVYGDQIDLVARALGISNREAIKYLAAHLGLSRDSGIEVRRATKAAQMKRERKAALNQEIDRFVKQAVNDSFEAERWIYLFKKHIYYPECLRRPGPVFALQNLSYIEHLNDQFCYGNPVDQLRAAKAFRRWEACQ